MGGDGVASTGWLGVPFRWWLGLVAVVVLVLGLAVMCPAPPRAQQTASTDQRVILTMSAPVWAGEVVVEVGPPGAIGYQRPEQAALVVDVPTNDDDGPRPLALVEVDGRVDGPALLDGPDAGRRGFIPDPADPLVPALTPWLEVDRWTGQTAVSGFDQNTGNGEVPLALPCHSGQTCRQRVSLRVRLIEPTEEDVEIDLEITARVDWSLGYAEVPPDPPPEGATVAVSVREIDDASPPLWPPVQVVDRGPDASVPLTIDYPADAEGGIARFVTGAIDSWARGDVRIEGWPERRIYTPVGRGVFEVPLVGGSCAEGRCRLRGTIGDGRNADAGPLRVAVDVRAAADLGAAAVDGVAVTIG